MIRRFAVFGLLALTAISLAPERSFAASKEIMELQRDVAILQESVKQLQQSQDKQLAALTVLVQQAVDASNRANTAVAVIQSSFQDNIRKQQSEVVTPVVGLTTRMNSLSDDMRTVSQAVSDLTAQISKIQSQLSDLNNAVKVIQAPAPAPPGAGGAVGPIGAQPGGPVGGGAPAMPPMSQQDLYNQARGDMNGGKVDLALQEFADYLKYYGNTDLAPNAQFYIAYIHYSQGLYDQAAGEFDQVLEKYPENNKTRDAMMYKGQSLVKAGKRSQGADEFKEIISRYPRTEAATQACSQLTALGLHCPSAGGTATKKKKGR